MKIYTVTCFHDLRFLGTGMRLQAGTRVEITRATNLPYPDWVFARPATHGPSWPGWDAWSPGVPLSDITPLPLSYFDA